jgi:hypothetical protein
MSRKVWLLTLVALLFFAPVKTIQAKDWTSWDTWRSLGAIEVGVELGFAGKPRIPADAVPEAVKQEAANPTIYHPRSGNTFYRDTIGTYNPGEEFDCGKEGRVYLRLLLTEWRLRPFAEIGSTYTFNENSVSTNNGRASKGYSYFRLLGSGVDEIGYWYGIKYNSNNLSPAAGLAFDINDNWRLIGRTQFQWLILTYQKGREAFAVPEGRTTLDTSKHNIYTHSLGIEFGGRLGSIGGGPWYRHTSNGLKGQDWGGYIALTFRPGGLFR